MNSFKSIAVLFLICVISAVSLAIVNSSTSGPREENQRKNIEIAQMEILPDAIKNNLGQIEFVSEIKDSKIKYFKVLDKNNNVLAYIAETAEKGYSSDVKLLMSFDKEKNILGVKPVSHSETPGLGAKIEEINSAMSKKMKLKNKLVDEKKPWFCEQYKGLSSEKLILKKDNPSGGTIDAITASTITSRAVTKALKKALEKFQTEN